MSNYTYTDGSKCRKRRRTALRFFAVLASMCVSKGDAFCGVRRGDILPNQRRMNESTLYFRTGSLDGTETFTPCAEELFSASLLHGGLSRPWLSQPKSYLVNLKLQRLQTALRESFFTENESLKLLFAIKEAASNDHHKIAGAAEFLVMLLETMELGLEALVAAAFHYCSCMTSRQQQSTFVSESLNMASFGEEVVQISRDAARLKELEMVASRLVEQKQQHTQSDAENLRMMLLSESKDWRALAIRSAACLYRLHGLLEGLANDGLDPEKVRVSREARWIYAPIASRLGMHRLKNELEGHAFQIHHKRQYERVAAFTSELISPHGPTAQEAMNNVLEHVQGEMIEMLENDEHFPSLVKDFSVTARVKEPYSLWRKMMKHSYRHIWEVPDAIALRIVLCAKRMSADEPLETVRARERALCYYAQRLCTDRWAPDLENPRFKDYIDHPKANGYQSLHYTANTMYRNKHWSLEIQVRSGEMHKVAEFGLASHFSYKAQKKSTSQAAKKQPCTSDSYMQLVQQWHWEQQGGSHLQDVVEQTEPVEDEVDSSWQYNQQSVSYVDGLPFASGERSDRLRTQRIQPYIEALATAQSDLTRDFVFVFFEPHGAVLSLPAGACVVDALRKGCNGVAWQHLPATNLNGRQTTVTKRLCNGDVLTVNNV